MFFYSEIRTGLFINISNNLGYHGWLYHVGMVKSLSLLVDSCLVKHSTHLTKRRKRIEKLKLGPVLLHYICPSTEWVWPPRRAHCTLTHYPYICETGANNKM